VALGIPTHKGGRRVVETWSFRWAAEVLHEFSKQGTGLEAAQVLNKEAANRHFRLSCLAPSILQRVLMAVSHRNSSRLLEGRVTLGNVCSGRRVVEGLARQPHERGTPAARRLLDFVRASLHPAVRMQELAHAILQSHSGSTLGED